ncbi:sulfotransferase domain-containing protein [Octadecabacter sp. CECT 8868]|uniref:sulfotransferase n=1 Tax=Octadecabacter algicola TaxID=2909342 RepID=UPI001F184F25|nr:sulfotransferase [Octadecabacter algicola]MCF2906683.1 sulfotransferase domain-containing protein [Octadecabacter algicola]
MAVAPNAYLIGAQKAGTTLLAALLDQSPDVCVSNPKEPQYLTGQYDRGPDWYAACFSNPDAKVLLDASTTYSFLRPAHALGDADAPGITAPVPQRIADLNPEARLIYILRDPVARAVSAYKHRLRYGDAPKGPVSMTDVLDADPMIELASKYADQIDRYLEVFDIERFLFIDFKDLTADPAAVSAVAAQHLGIAPPPPPPASKQDGAKHSAHRATGLGRALKSLRGRAPWVETGLRRAVPQALQKKLIAPFLKQDIAVEITGFEEVAGRFELDRARVKTITGLDI